VVNECTVWALAKCHKSSLAIRVEGGGYPNDRLTLRESRAIRVSVQSPCNVH